MTEVYKSVNRLLGQGRELSPEVRDVFDNLLLTEREGRAYTMSHNMHEAITDCNDSKAVKFTASNTKKMSMHKKHMLIINCLY